MTMLTERPTTYDLVEILAKFNRLHDKVAAETLERETEIHCFLAALASGTHIFFLGDPGVAKSMLVERVMARFVDAVFFNHLFGAFTGPDDIYGPIDLAGYENGHHRRLIAGYLPTAHVFFGDEYWKAGESISNTQLRVLNERRFPMDGQDIHVPLSTAVIASNELPQSDTLNAIYDRIPQRLDVSRLQEAESFLRLLELDLPDVDQVEKFLTWDEVKAVQAAVRKVKFPRSVGETMLDIKKAAEAKGFEPSDRRWKQAVRILQAEAWLDGCDTVETDHLSALIHVLPDDPRNSAEITKIVLDRANPLQKELLGLIEDVNKIGDMVPVALASNDEDERQQMGLEIHRKLRDAAGAFKKLEAHPAAQSRKNAGPLESCRARIKSLADASGHGLFAVEMQTGL